MTTARFRGFLTSEIPESWNQATRPETQAHVLAKYNITADRLERYTVVEVPETPRTREWVLWIHSQPSTGYVPPMFANQTDFIALRGLAALTETLLSLPETGRPLPFWAHIWTRRSVPQ